MAPTLKGGHLSQRCRDCAFPFHVAVDLLSDPQRLTCPNCGYRENPLEESQRTGGERVWIDRWKRSFNRLERWDMVAFHHRFGQEASREGSKLAVKRIIGLPGETVEMKNGTVRINGIPLKEPYVEKNFTQDRIYIRVPAKSYFVLGDNRQVSNDSRRWGVVPLTHVVGQTGIRYWPISQISTSID